MRNLLGTHLGHASIVILCCLLKDETVKEYSLLRSSVSFIGMGLWGPKCVTSLIYKPQSILSAFKCALSTRSPMLGLEITLTCHCLVKKFGHELHACAWDEMLHIIDMLQDIISDDPLSEQIVSLKQNVHELLTIIEKLHHLQAFNGSTEELFRIIKANVKSRPFDSLLLLVSYRAEAIRPTETDWILKLGDFVDTYLISLTNTKAKLKVLDILTDIVVSNINVYEKELVDNIVIAKFPSILEESNYTVKENVVDFLLKICAFCKTSRSIAILQILKPFSRIDSAIDLDNDPLLSCMKVAVEGLAELFESKFNSEYAPLSVEAFHFLVNFLESYYDNEDLCKHPTIFKTVREKILTVFLQLRLDIKMRVSLLSKRYCDTNICCLRHEESDRDTPNSPVVKTRSLVVEHSFPFQRSFSCFSKCFNRENYWPILDVTIDGVHKLLNNKCLDLALNSKDIDALAESVTGLISSSNRVLTLTGAPPTFKRPDLMAAALTLIPVLASYHKKMSITRQRQLLRCLEAGFNSKCAKQCISATTLCIVEMRSEALQRNLPSILLRLSQMSATVPLATAVLELLSTVAQLPELYSSFNDDQYMSAFKIALQHADTDKFSLYVVSLAHHVITMWFIKCRLAFRPDFVRYITLSLQSSCRDSAKDSLQHDLIESCVDVMARYTFSNGVPKPKKLEKQRGFSRCSRRATWMLGNRLITIQTNISFEKPNSKRSSSLGFQDTAIVNSALEGNVLCPDKKISAEAPAKLGSSDQTSIKNTRQRHKSSCAVLRQSSNSFSNHTVNSCEERSGDSFNSHQSSSDGLSSGWAEIYIRRPSGSTSWLINSHQFNLGLNPSEDSKEDFNHAQDFSQSISDLRGNEQKDIDSSGDSADWTQLNDVTSRQRSRTVSSSQDYMVDAAARAKSRVGHLLSERSFDNPVESCNTFSPEFVFLQLFHYALIGEGVHRPLLIPDSATMERSINVLDLIPPYDTWQTGVVYVRSGQSDSGKEILRNSHGSVRFQDLISSLGTLVWLNDCDPDTTHLGGLDYADGEDGQMTYVWQESVMQMVFHVATLMPNRESSVSNKQRHIGNDYVTIVYDDNATPSYTPGSVVKGQFLSVEIIISPQELGYNIVKLFYHKPELKTVMQPEDQYTVSDVKLALFVRQLALHASMASAAHHLKPPEIYVSKALSRLKQLKRIRSRALQEIAWKDEEKTRKHDYTSSLFSPGGIF